MRFALHWNITVGQRLIKDIGRVEVISPAHGAKVVQLVEYDLAKVEIVGSSPILRSKFERITLQSSVGSGTKSRLGDTTSVTKNRRNTGLRGTRTKNRCKSVRIKEPSHKSQSRKVTESETGNCCSKAKGVVSTEDGVRRGVAKSNPGDRLIMQEKRMVISRFF